MRSAPGRINYHCTNGMRRLRDTQKLQGHLLEWFQGSRRDLPWRRTQDPWAILLSEVMLQQTRVSVVIPYYERFLARYPTPADLAAAPEGEFLALWSGLGYYARARNLQKAARAIAERGGFPETHSEIAALPGVGDYTAAAVASIAFGLPHAVLDGNVLRVLARVSAETGDAGSQAVRARLKELAQRLLPQREPGDFNQALMELGATVCLPKNPQCLVCPWRDECAGRIQGIQHELPVKPRKREPVRLALRLYVIERDGRVLMRCRDGGETRLAGFWELPEAREIPNARNPTLLGEFRHSITKHDYLVEVYTASVTRAPKGYAWVTYSEIEKRPVATTARKALRVAGRIPFP